MDGNHYYSTNPSSDRRPGQISVRVRGVSLTLHTDAGVFSRRGLDFGTRLLLETVDLDAAREVVDLGCGYGVVAAVLGRVYPETHWTLVDVNARAIELAEQNTRHLGDRRLVVQSDGFAELPGLMVDAVLLNPPIRAGKAVVYRLFEEAKAHLVDGGSLWIVIQKKQGAPTAQRKLEELFSDVTLVERASGYHIFRADKLRP